MSDQSGYQFAVDQAICQMINDALNMRGGQELQVGDVVADFEVVTGLEAVGSTTPVAGAVVEQRHVDAVANARQNCPGVTGGLRVTFRCAPKAGA